MSARRKPKVKQVDAELLKAIEEFFRLLGQAKQTPGVAQDVALGRHVTANADLFIRLFESASTTVGTGLKISGWIDKYVEGSTPGAATPPGR